MNELPRTRTVDGPVASGEVHDEGALVLRWAPRGHDPVLFVHPTAGVRPGTPPHAGIPVCWPWFGPGPAPDAPSHGFARTAHWRHVATTTSGDVTTVDLALTTDTTTSPWWPHDSRVTLRAVLGESLEVTLTTHNTGDEPVVVGEALHAYLAVGDVRRVTITGLDGATFHDKVTGEDRTQDGDLVLTGETDRVYRSTAPVVVSDPVLGRRLRVETEGAADRVVWNPWAEKGPGIADIGDEWPRFVCVEAANVLDDTVTIAPGESRSMAYRLTLEDL